MLDEARKKMPENTFYLSDSKHLPIDSNKYDLVFSSLVLFEMPNIEILIKNLKEIKRVLKDKGVAILTTGSEEMYRGHYNSIDGRQYKQNKNLKSGDTAKVLLKNIDLILEDTFFTDDDYRFAFKESGLELIETDSPLGDNLDNEQWFDELHTSPYITYVVKK